MAKLTQDVEPDEVGFDPRRLARLDAHFQAYVDDGRLPCFAVVIGRGDHVAHVATYGQRDVEAGLPVEPDTIFRVYSMTKPVTSVAAMMLVEEGRLALTDPVARYLPAFADVPVYRGGNPNNYAATPAAEPMRVWHLLTHTSGLTYGFHHAHTVDEVYRNAGFEFSWPQGLDLAGVCDAWARLPLLFEPGAEWNYSVSTDVLGRVVEVVSGQPLDEFFAERIFTPLGMTDTGFWVGESDRDRLAALYSAVPRTRQRVRNDAMGRAYESRPAVLSGGGGLVSTAGDYHRFAQMLRRGGELDGARLLGPRTLAYMTRNHLPGGADLESFGRPLFSETPYAGVGFGLGFSVVTDPAAMRSVSVRGEFGWGGLASTTFWVTPAEELTVLFLTQLMPSSHYPIRPELRHLVYAALVD